MNTKQIFSYLTRFVVDCLAGSSEPRESLAWQFLQMAYLLSVLQMLKKSQILPLPAGRAIWGLGLLYCLDDVAVSQETKLKWQIIKAVKYRFLTNCYTYNLPTGKKGSEIPFFSRFGTYA